MPPVGTLKIEPISKHFRLEFPARGQEGVALLAPEFPPPPRVAQEGEADGEDDHQGEGGAQADSRDYRKSSLERKPRPAARETE